MEKPTESDIIHRELDTDDGNPAVQVAEAIAEIEGIEPTELTNTHDCIDGVLDHLFSNPPSPEAQMEVIFSYEGYRVTVRQDGTAEFMKT